MKKFNKIVSLLLVLAMMLSLVACGGGSGTTTETKAAAPAAAETEAAAPAAYVDPFADIADDYDELSQAVYDEVLGEFNALYEEAKAETNLSMRHAKMALAEAKLMSAGAFLITTSNGGAYQITRKAPKTNTPVLWGNDSYRYHDVVATEELIETAHYEEMKAKWNELVGTGEYEQWVKDYLTEKGYTIKDNYNWYFTADVESWDVLATSYAADSEILVNTYDGLLEYDMENVQQPALAESVEVSEDGLTYTFKIREGQIWVDNQGRKVADVKADDWVAGMQHMLDAMGGMEYLVQGVIVGVNEYIEGTTTNFEDVGVKAIDDYTLQYTLTQPTSYFLTMLAYGVFAPLSREYYESMGGTFGTDYDPAADSYKYGKGPDSIAYNGPFVVTNYTSKNTIVFEANEAYWDAAGNNIVNMAWAYQDGSDPLKGYNDTLAGVMDIWGLNSAQLEVAKQDGNFDKYVYVGDTGSTSYCGFINLRRATLANAADANAAVSTKTEEDVVRYNAAILNTHFRRALIMSFDRAAWNAQSVGEELKLNSLRNSYTPGTYVNITEEVTVDINGTPTTFPAGTMYGEIMQAQIDADGVTLTVWNGTSSDGFDGWYNPDNAAAELALAVEELAAVGIEVSAENPIYLDHPYNAANQVSTNRANAYKQSVETALGGAVLVNLVECATLDIYQGATYRFNMGNEANFDISTGSGWGPDYGDPQTYLDTMLPQYAGYMTKNLGVF